MTSNEAVRFFDTSACLNLNRPTTGVPLIDTNRPKKRSVSSSIQNRAQLKIDLYNFDHLDFIDSKYVLTSPRSLEACARLNVKPVTLLPKRLADVQDEFIGEKVRLSTLSNVRDQLEVDRLANLQRCREEREKIIREETLGETRKTSKTPEPQPSSFHDVTQARPSFFPTRFNPSNSLLDGLNKPTTINTVPVRSQSATAVKFVDVPTENSSTNRWNVPNSILKSSTNRQLTEEENLDENPSSTSNAFLDDFRHINRNLQRMTISENRSKTPQDLRYMNGLENVREIIERRAAYDPELAEFEKKQYEILRGHFDHELKLQRAQEKARITEKRNEIERYESLLDEFQDQSLAEQRRRKEIQRKVEKLHQNRNLYESLQAKNYEQQLNDTQRRRMELLSEIRRKDQRSKHFMKDKEQATNLSRTLAKSSQDLREYLRESQANFNEMVKKAELNSSVLVSKPKKTTIEHRQLRSSIRT